MATTRKVWILAMVVMLGSLAVALGQTAPSADGDQSGGGGGGGRGGRNYDPAQARQRMEERLKDALGASDDEFKALQPKIDRVMQLRRDASGFGGFGRGGRRNGGGQGGDGGARGGQGGDANLPPSAVQQRTQDLRELLDKKDAPAADIKAKLDALREAKTKAKDELTKAQQELREVLTQRQEATLVMWGMLD